MISTEPRSEAAAEPATRLPDAAAWSPAGVRGEDLASDLRDYRGGRLGWADVERGILLSGPSGSGKSAFAAEVAAKAGVDLVLASGAPGDAGA